MKAKASPKFKNLYLDIAIINAGFFSIVGQAILIRELTSAFYGNELSLGIILTSWLFWMAAGSYLLSRFIEKVKIGIEAFPLTQLLISIFFPLVIFLARIIRVILGVSGGEILGYFPMLISCFFLIAPVSLLIGFQFVLGCHIYSFSLINPKKAVGRMYIYDALGDMIGGFVFGYIFVNIFHSFQSIFYSSLLNLLIAIYLLLKISKIKKIVSLLLVTGLIFNLWGIFYLNRLDRFTTSIHWKGFNIVETATSKYSNHVVIKRGNLYSFYQNGILGFTNPDRLSFEELVHFPLLQCKDPKRILILNGAVGGALYEALKYPILEIYYIEQDKKVLEIAKKYITQLDLKALQNPKVKILNIDPRYFIKNYKGDKFDCVILNIGEPFTAERNRFYTLEFFRELKRIINSKGVVSINIRSNENYLGRSMLRYNSSIYNTFKKIYPNIVLIPGDNLFLIASPESSYLTSDPEILTKRLKKYNIKNVFLKRYYFFSKFDHLRINYLKGVLEDCKEVRKNYDFFPVCYYFAFTLWGGQFSKMVEKIFFNLYNIRLREIFIFITIWGVVLILFRSLRRRLYLPIGVFIVGAGGICAEIILVIGFQVIYGYIYHMIGIIIASFMLGIVLGSSWMNRNMERIKNKRFYLAILLLIYAIYLCSFPFIFYSLRGIRDGFFTIFSIKILFPLLTVLGGYLTGLIFPLANRIYLVDGRKVAQTGGFLYALDLLGAGIGAIFTTILLIPLFGISNTCFILAYLCFLSFLLISFNLKSG